MPASIPADWPAIAALAASGSTLQELSAQFGIKLDTLKARCRRGGWKTTSQAVHLKRVEKATNAGQMAPKASHGVEVVRDTLAEYGNKTKLNLAKAVHNASEAAGALDGPAALACARSIKETVGSASTLHRWDANGGENTISVNLLLQQNFGTAV